MNRKLIISIGIVLALLIFSYPILAVVTAPVVIEKDDQNRPIVIIEQGKGREAGLVKVTYIHYAKPGSRPQPPTKTDTCYKLAQWKWLKLPIQYTINPENGSKNTATIKAAITSADTEWDEVTNASLFSSPVENVTFWSGYNGINSISFEYYGSSGIIAVTSTWYRQGKIKEAVESDILFNTYYPWGDGAKNPEVMDLQNIATHEIGHTLGLSDIYSTSCQNVTMYGYSDYGEIYKRTLESSDIAGLRKIYGL